MATAKGFHPITLRDYVIDADKENIRRLTLATNFFTPEEVDIAVELVEEKIARGADSSYSFLFVEKEGKVVSYSCFGLIPCTLYNYDLYWIAVNPEWQGAGLGRFVMDETERRIESCGGHGVYLDTSGRVQYDPTRSFYERCGYEKAAIFKDFYAPCDDKVVYWKKLV